MINGSCVQVSCAIQGQQSINGICQCTNINEIVQGSSCVCPINASVIGNACLCNIITGQVMVSGQCVCPTIGAIIVNGVCTCGQNSLNISNTCSCPTGSTLQAGVCTCTNINAYISGNTCVCPQYSVLVGNVCTCPQYSQISGNTCICNLVTGQIMNAGTCICTTNGAFINSGTCSCGVNSFNISNTCSCPVNSALIGGVCTCTISGQIMQSNACLCLQGYAIIGGICKQSTYQYISADSLLTCNQATYLTSFDISTITNSISSGSFSNGYVFSSTNSISNAFINVNNNVYAIINPLFQSQSIFLNIKIQIETQSVSSGSILTQSQTININQMNIISKDGSYITVNSGSQVNIFVQSSTNVNINNLLINLSFAMSSGNITLINSISGLLNVTGYRILGVYQSTSAITMLGIIASSVTANLIQVSFQPNIYNIGNYSSYLFGVIYKSAVTFTNIVVNLGNSSIYQTITQVASTTSILYQYGGITCYVNISTVNINNFLSDSYQKFSTSYVSNSDMLIGNISVNSIIVISNVCMQQKITSSYVFNSFGLVGLSFGNTQLNQLSMSLSVQGDVTNFGIIGYQFLDSIYSEIKNVRTSVNITQGSLCVAALFGFQGAKTSSIQNAVLINSNIVCSSIYVGGIIGNASGNITIQNSSTILTNIKGSGFVGGFIGYQYSYTIISNSSIQQTSVSCLQNFVGGFTGIVSNTIQLLNSKLYQTNISASISYSGGLLGTSFAYLITIQSSSIQQVRVSIGSSTEIGIVCYNSGATFAITNSFSSGNFVNNVLQSNCASFTNNWSLLQCS
ncbi:Conserved_hypothetical protein [Hexamita inflata]|uniref:Uncharacterized protein n=1 Tax=Hexamita inflata TaxID=28002 RepID=A0ABP1HM13_9EUKA